MAARQIDMTGQRYGTVTGLRLAGRNKSRGFVWRFSCDCGSEFDATGSEVRYGRIKSCPGCASKKKRDATTTHGLTQHDLYRVWSAMKRRCLNPRSLAFAEYGGRGISVCARWVNSFENFLCDMGERPSVRHSIDRIDVNGNYEPTNCRWATCETQANNKRNNRQITIDGVTKTLAMWAARSGVTESCIRSRIKRGITGADLIASDPRKASLVFRGEKKTLEQWAGITGIKKGTLSSRIYVYGWPIDRALTEGVSK